MKHIQANAQLYVVRNGVNRMPGPHRCPVDASRTAVPSPAAGRWARPAVAGYACGAEGRVVVLTHGCSLARSASPPSALSALSSTLPRVAALRLLSRVLQKLAEDLRDCGKLDLSESFIDASFSSAKKGALGSVLQNPAKAAKSWQSQTAMVFLSQCRWSVLRRMKPPRLNPSSSDDFSAKRRSD